MGRFLNLPPIPQIPEPVRGKSFVIVEVYHLGDPAEADRPLAPLRALGPVNDTVATIPVPVLAICTWIPKTRCPAPATACCSPAARRGDRRLCRGRGRGRGVPAAVGRGAPPRRRVRPDPPGQGALASIDAQFVLFAVGITPVPELVAPVGAGRRGQAGARAVGGGADVLNFAETSLEGHRSGRRPASGCVGSRRTSTPAMSSVPTTRSRPAGETGQGGGPGMPVTPELSACPALQPPATTEPGGCDEHSTGGPGGRAVPAQAGALRPVRLRRQPGRRPAGPRCGRCRPGPR